MINIFNFLFNKERLIKNKAKLIVKNVNLKHSTVKTWSHEEILKTINNIKCSINNSPYKLKNNLVLLLAIFKEVAVRTICENPTDQQILSIILMLDEVIVQMETGGGKTLIVAGISMIFSLIGKVHVVTSNEQLAHRDFNWMSPIFKYLNISTTSILGTDSIENKKIKYNSDIAYMQSSTIVFDLLFESHSYSQNVFNLKNKFNTLIVDEADNLLLDQISIPYVTNLPSRININVKEIYNLVDLVCKNITLNDVVIEEEFKTCTLKSCGFNKIISSLKNYKKISENDVYSKNHFFIFHFIDNYIKAKFVLKNGKDYYVQNNKIILIDQNTGRTATGRAFSNGLHQAIEFNEGLENLTNFSLTSLTTTQTAFITLYQRVSGITGTAIHSKDEFIRFFGINVIEVAQSNVSKRLILPTKVFFTEKEKIEYTLEFIKKKINNLQPVLLCTNSINEIEIYSKKLKEQNINFQTLSAKVCNYDKEFDIISNAGVQSMVTLSTNIAGRGTNITLGGNLQMELKKSGIKEFSPEWYKLKNRILLQIQKHKKIISERGGLCVISTQKFLNKRIDSQVRGRSARYGDNGESIFLLSYEDEILKRAGLKNSIFVAKLFEAFVPSRVLNNKIFNSIFGYFYGEGIFNNAQKILTIQDMENKRYTLDQDAVFFQHSLEFFYWREKIKSISLDEVIKKCLKISNNKEMLNKIILILEKENKNHLLSKQNLSASYINALNTIIKKVGLSSKNDNLINKSFYEMNQKESLNFILKDTILKEIDNLWTEFINIIGRIKLEAYSVCACGKDQMLEYKKQVNKQFEIFKIHCYVGMASSLLKYFY